MHELLTYQGVHDMLNHIKDDHPALVEELVPAHMSVNDIQSVLATLLKAHTPIRNLPSILEILLDNAPNGKDTETLAEIVQAKML